MLTLYKMLTMPKREKSEFSSLEMEMVYGNFEQFDWLMLVKYEPILPAGDVNMTSRDAGGLYEPISYYPISQYDKFVI